MISVQNVIKSYGKNVDKVLAVNKVSFEVKAGEIFGLIGPDGAGKTSIFRMLTTLLLPDSGTLTVDGKDCEKSYQEIRKMVGYMPGKFSLYQDLSIEENLDFFASVFNTTVEENYELIKDIYVQIEPFKTRRAGKLSGGMKQKLALCCALIHQPKVLFLDEPTTGVDPVSRKEFWEMLKKLKQKGITILVATPYMDEASLCDRIALIQNGKILKITTPTEIPKQYPEKLFKVKADGKLYHLLRLLKSYPKTKNVYAFGDKVHLMVDKNTAITPEEISNYLSHKGLNNIKTTAIEANVEDTFIWLLS